MPHVNLSSDAPGISGLFASFPETAKPMRGLAEQLLRGPSPLSPAERELIAAYVSSGNECVFCTQSHSSAARHLFGEEHELVDEVLENPTEAGVDERLKALLHIAGKVRRDGRLVTEEDIEQAREAGADDRAIHDTVLIAAAFCMFNRYVDGLATWAPTERQMYDKMGERMAREGYLRPSPNQ